MAKLIIPTIAHRDTEYGDGLWHLSYPDGGPVMVCGVFIHRTFRESKNISELVMEEICHLCLYSMEVEDN